MIQKRSVIILWLTIIVVFCISCRFTTYTPRSKRQKQLAKPSIVLLERIGEFNEKYNTWPLTKEEFISKGARYKEAFTNFPYQYTRFKIIDSDNMIFYFDQHVHDITNFNMSQKVDLNSYRGEVRFFKEKEKLRWKIKMY